VGSSETARFRPCYEHAHVGTPVHQGGAELTNMLQNVYTNNQTKPMCYQLTGLTKIIKVTQNSVGQSSTQMFLFLAKKMVYELVKRART
jgi:hypothetical protein